MYVCLVFHPSYRTYINKYYPKEFWISTSFSMIWYLMKPYPSRPKCRIFTYVLKVDHFSCQDNNFHLFWEWTNEIFSTSISDDFYCIFKYICVMELYLKHRWSHSSKSSYHVYYNKERQYVGLIVSDDKNKNILISTFKEPQRIIYKYGTSVSAISIFIALWKMISFFRV